MTEPDEDSFPSRLERLEESVARIERILKSLAPRLAAREGLSESPAEATRSLLESTVPEATATPAHTWRPKPRVASPQQDLTPALVRELSDKGMDYWFSRVGIGLVLLAVAFLFKYSIDRGWLTPWVRVGIGLAVGGVLYGIGFRVRARRRIFAHLMLGGGSVALYTTAFAAFQVLELVHHPEAFGFMVAVTLGTLLLAVREDGVELAVLGAVGGFLTPFLLYTPTGSVPGLVTYSCVLIAGLLGIYLFKGWRDLLGTTVVGGTLVLLAAFEAATGGAVARQADALAVQLGFLVALVAFWWLPVLREVLVAREPDRWPAPPSRVRRTEPTAGGIRQPIPFFALLPVIVPVLVVLVSSGLWADGERLAGWGAVALAGAALWAWSRLREEALVMLATAHVASTAALVGIAVPLLLTGDAMIVAWAVEGMALHAFAQRMEDRGATIVAHCVMVVPAAAMVPRLMDVDPNASPLFNQRALRDLGVLGAGMLSAAFLSGNERRVYVLVAYGGVLAWLWRELVSLPEGQAYVTAAWGIIGIVLLLAGLRVGNLTLRSVGAGTLFVVVAKLFLVDLSNVDALVRIVLFMVFGAAFLAIGYFFPALWRDSRDGAVGS